MVLAGCRAPTPTHGPAGARPGVGAQPERSPAVVDLSVIPQRACAVLAGGELRCWGDNTAGRLGDGTERRRRFPHPVHGITDAAQVALGTSHACARHRDGSVSCWGSNRHGQLGDGTREDRLVPVVVQGLRDVVDVGVGDSHACAVRADGHVWCWGSNEHGQLGDGTLGSRVTPVAVEGLSRVRRVYPSKGSTCAWRHDGSVWCWGSDDGGLSGRDEPAPRCGDSERSPTCWSVPRGPARLPPIVDLAVGDRHACAVTRDGAVLCWGSTFACEQGVSTFETVRVPRAVEGVPPVAALPGPQCVRTRADELVCWGQARDAPEPTYDDLDGGMDGRCTMQRVRPELARGALRIAAHERGGCLVRDDGRLWCWGDGEAGQLGNGSEVSRPEGVEVVALHEPPPPDDPTPLQAMTRALARAGVPERGHALVWHDAPVYADAAATEAVGSITADPAVLRGEGRAGVLPVRIVARHGERVEVEPLGPSEARSHCGGASFPGFDRYAVRMVVAIHDLAPVIAREYAMGYPDGSGVTLGAGVPLRPVEAGVVVRVDGLVLPLELADGDAALAYDAPGLATPAGGVWWELPPLASHAVLTLDDRRVYADELYDLLSRVRWARTEEAGVARVHTEDGCVALDMIADDPVPTRGGAGGAGQIGGGHQTVTFTRVREGAPAFWPGGARAGTVRASYRTREALVPDGERRCVTLAGGLLVCHEPTDLSAETDEVSRWSGE